MKRSNSDKDIILITGATGHLATYLSSFLSDEYELRFLTTKKTIVDSKRYFYWNINKKFIDPNCVKNCKYVIHLAGYSILNRWSKKNKKIIYESRVNSTKMLFELFKSKNIKPEAFICSSAVGLYKDSENIITEESAVGTSWLAQMAKDWEDAANKFKTVGSRVVLMRISLIFSKHAGFLKYNLLSLKFRLAVIFGNENNIINWMHIEDISRFIKFSLENKDISGSYNLATSESMSQSTFYKLLRKHIFYYSIIIKIPKFILRFFLGDRSQILLSNFNLSTRKLNSSGFVLKYDTIDKLIDNIKSKEN